MRRAAAAGLLALALSGVLESAATSSNTVPTTTASHRSVTVIGASPRWARFTTVAGSITAVQVRLRGTSLLTSNVRARFGTGTTVTCTTGLLSLVGGLTGAKEGTYVCTGFVEDAERPRPLRITVV